MLIQDVMSNSAAMLVILNNGSWMLLYKSWNKALDCFSTFCTSGNGGEWKEYFKRAFLRIRWVLAWPGKCLNQCQNPLADLLTL